MAGREVLHSPMSPGECVQRVRESLRTGGLMTRLADWHEVRGEDPLTITIEMVQPSILDPRASMTLVASTATRGGTDLVLTSTASVRGKVHVVKMSRHIARAVGAA